MCDKVVNTYPSTIKFVPEFFMIQMIEMCDEAVNSWFFLVDSISDWWSFFDSILPWWIYNSKNVW